MLGNVFSPYYARARERDAHTADPIGFCTLHAGVYGPDGRRAWALTERGRTAVTRASDHLAIGPSTVHWDGDTLVVTLDESTAPFPGRIRGTIRLHPHGLPSGQHPIDTYGRHHWWPVAPCARVEVELREPAIRWSGRGYHDANAGDEALDAAFTGWHWSRAALPDGAVVYYDIAPRHGPARLLSLGFDRNGTVTPLEPPPVHRLQATRWGLGRTTRALASDGITVARTMEDTPFYARSVLSGRVRGVPAQVIHEALDLQRFRAQWVRFLLPFRMKRS